jgi:hypothetical protein
MPQQKTDPNDFASPTGDHSGYTATAGLTKRERFAMAAMQGFAADPNMATTETKDVAKLSVTWADALIKALNEEKPKE